MKNPEITDEMRDNLTRWAMWQSPGYVRQNDDHLLGPEIADLKAAGLMVAEQTERKGVLLKLTALGEAVARGDA